MSHKGKNKGVQVEQKNGVLTSRERVRRAINHKEPDRIPLDLGSTLVTGIQAGIYTQLKDKTIIMEISLYSGEEELTHRIPYHLELPKM